MHFHRRQVLLVGAIPFAPLAKAQHHRSQRACQRRSFIFDARGDFRVNVSDDQAVCLQLAQLQRKHALGRAGDQSRQFHEALLAGQHMKQQ